MKVYSYSRCATCRKSIAWLKAHGLEPEVIDITLQPPSIPDLELALSQLGRKRLLNISGQSYRALGAAAVQAMDDATLVAVLAGDGRLVKRPFLITDDGQVITGFKPEEWQACLG